MEDTKIRQTPRETGNTKLHEASWLGDVAKVKALIAEHPDSVHTRNAQGEMPLHQAAKFGNRETIETLIAAGAQVNARSRQGDTPLHLAAWASNDAGIKALVRAGADKSIKNVSGQKPIDLAIQRGRKREMIEALKSARTDKKMAFLDWMKNRGQQPQAPPKQAAPAQAPPETPQQAQDLAQGLKPRQTETIDQVRATMALLDKATSHIQGGPHPDPPSSSPAAMRQNQSNQEKEQAALSPTDHARGKTTEKQRGKGISM
jgi:hypothetical protein